MPAVKKGILGGSFNPVHDGHLLAARFAKEKLSLCEVIFLPANIPPHKSFDDAGVTTKERLEMLSLALSKEQGFKISLDEIERQGKSYTIDTLREFHKKEPETKFYFIIGSDMLFYFEQWKDFKEIFKLCTIVALSRLKKDEQRAIVHKNTLAEKYGADIIVLKNEIREISSTEIRKKVRNGEDFSRDVPEMVRDYIEKNHIYDERYDFESLSKKIREMTTEKRFRHIESTIKEAVELAKRFGANEKKARLAALLHDSTKNLGEAEQYALMEKYGLSFDQWTKKEPKLFHAVTGAVFAKEELLIEDEEILSAIRYHTTGKADMTLLEKIIYLADMIEETRKEFPDLKKIREVSKVDLSEAVLLALYSSQGFLKKRGGMIHPDTERAINFLTKSREK